MLTVRALCFMIKIAGLQMRDNTTEMGCVLPQQETELRRYSCPSIVPDHSGKSPVLPDCCLCTPPHCGLCNISLRPVLAAHTHIATNMQPKRCAGCMTFWFPRHSIYTHLAELAPKLRSMSAKTLAVLPGIAVILQRSNRGILRHD